MGHQTLYAELTLKQRRLRSQLEHHEFPADREQVDEFVFGALPQIRSELKNVESALQRIKRQKYGKCRVCCKRIERSRLAILPETELCSRCTKKGQKTASAQL